MILTKSMSAVSLATLMGWQQVLHPSHSPHTHEEAKWYAPTSDVKSLSFTSDKESDFGIRYDAVDY